MKWSFETILVLVVLVGLIAMLVRTKVQPALIFLGAMSILLFAGLISTKSILSHFANETVITLMVLLQVTSAVERSPFIPWLSFHIFKKGSQTISQFRLSILTMLLSGLLNNTAIVASFMGVVKNNKYFSPSKFLIPLSFAAILGGTITLIGTSTNLIVNGFVVEAGYPGLGFFDFVFVGVPVAFVGGLLLVFVVPRFLPDYGHDKGRTASQYFVEARVKSGSKLVGRSVQENGFRNLSNLFLAEIIRENRLISPVNPDELLLEGDALVFTGDVRDIQELNQYDGLTLVLDLDPKLMSNLQEVVVAHNSSLIGQSVKDAQFRTRFDAAVVAVARGDEKLSGKIGQIVLEAGDSLILAAGKEFNRHLNLRRNFYRIGSIRTHDYMNWKQGWVVAGLFVGGIAVAALGILSLFKVMLILLLAFIAMRFIKISEMKNNTNIDLLIMIGCSLGLAEVMSTYGIDKWISGLIVGLFGNDSAMGALAGIFIATALLTEIVTNNAAAALLFPIALSTAQNLGVSPVPFFMALAFAASSSFITPIGYQTNTMVYSIGRYRFKDYFLPGILIKLTTGALAIYLLPKFFPFEQ